jgi:DNA polymerase-3 subunit alpha
MAALLTSVTGSSVDVVKYINECRDMGIEVEPPDINVSDANFTPHGKAIRFGLGAVKNVGHNAIESIVAARKELGANFASIYEFCEKVDLRLLNRRVLESLIKSGAMDSLGRRAQLMAVLDKAMERAQKAQRDAESGQHGLFGVFDDAPSATQQHANDVLPNVPDWDEHQRLASEKEILGFFVSGHPLEKYRHKLMDFRAKTTEDICGMTSSTGKDENITTAGVLTGVRVAKSKKGDLYAQGAMEDMNGKVDFVCFADNYKKLAERLKLEVPVLVKAGVRVEEGSNPKLMISDIIPLDEAKPKLPRSVKVRLALEKISEGTVDELHRILTEHRGEARLLFNLERSGDFMVVMDAEGYNVMPDYAFISRVEELCGKDTVKAVD